MDNTSDITLRIEAIQNYLSDDHAALILSDKNRQYFSGFTSSAGCVFITKSKAIFITDSRYIEKAKKQIKCCDTLELNRSYYNDIFKLCKDNNISAVEFEAGYLSVSAYSSWKIALGEIYAIADGCLDKRISNLRSIKQSSEIELIGQAQQITDAAFAHILDFIKIGRTEKEIALELEFFMRKNGAENVAFDTIVVSGPNSSMPHGVPGERTIQQGDLITMDFGAQLGGYCSDMTRTVAVGEIDAEKKYVYDTVLLAQRTALAALKPNMPCCDGDKAARDIIAKNGYGKFFKHSTGHSVGLDIHENPNLSPACSDLLKPGIIMTVEPGIYLEGKFGVRIEDMVLITQDGIDNFTKSPKNLIYI